MTRFGGLSSLQRELTGKVLCECCLARCFAELHPCDREITLPDGVTIVLFPRQYVRIFKDGRCPNNNDFDRQVSAIVTKSDKPREGLVVFQGSDIDP